MTSVAVVEDNPNRRETRVEILEDAGFEAIGLKGPYAQIDSILDEIQQGFSASVCDFQLRSRGWAQFEGAQLVSELIQRNVPSLLVTRFSTAMMSEIQRYRRHIPVLLESSEADDPDLIRTAFQRVTDELSGNIPPTRRPWRAIVRLEEVTREGPDPHALAVIPSWNHQEGIKLPLDRFPADWLSDLDAGFRFFAMINIGATEAKQLFVENFHQGGGI